VGSKAELGKIL